MLKEIKLPDLGEGIDSADVSEILVSPGDNVSVDDIILVLESEKASMEIPSEDNGVVKKVFVSSGDVVKTGEILIMLEVAKSSESKVEKKDIKDFKESATESRTIERKQEQIIEKNTVQVTNFDMPLGNMVLFMVKWAIASIPAFIILAIIVGIFFVIFEALFF